MFWPARSISLDDMSPIPQYTFTTEIHHRVPKVERKPVPQTTAETDNTRLTATIQLTPTQISQILVEYLKTMRGITVSGDVRFNVESREVGYSGNGHVDHVFTGVTIETEL